MQSSSGNGRLGPDNTVIFDLFHTLTSSLVDAPGVGRTSEILGLDPMAWNNQLWNHTHDRVVGIQRDPHAIVRTVAHALDPTISDDRIREATAARIRRFKYLLREIPPQNVSAIRALRAQGHKIGLISNADVMEVAGWSDSPIAPFFHSAIFSCEIGLKKPQPEIFEASLRELKVRAGECFFVGDGGSEELQGARSVGMHTVLMTGVIQELWPERIEERRPHAEFEISRIDELLGPLSPPPR